MRAARKSLIAAVVVALLSAIAVGLSPSAASAAPYNGACGTGYNVLDSRDIIGATVYVTYNPSNGYNCAATIRDSSGAAVSMGAAIKRSSASTWVVDDGSYTTYAGPVYVHAPGQCIDWAGYYGPTSNEVRVFNDFCN
ncbi:spore-associated protein A [Nocardiopsis alba]|uniref:spore-associated protein A n=1 Tax=Nocardiopsis alba TaxID=53437 RepID=UPI0033E9AE56